MGPVQMLVIGFEGGEFKGEIAAELQDLRTQDAIRVLDVLRVRRGFDGGMTRLDPLDPHEHPGSLVEALLVSDPAQEAPAAEVEPPIEDGAWFLADRVPPGAAAAILLIEHRWAIPLREAASQFEAEIFGDAWVHPRDLAAARRVVAENARS